MPVTYFLDMSFQNQPDQPDVAAWMFTAQESEAEWAPVEQSFFIKKAKRPGDEIDIRTLPPELQERWTKKGGARDKGMEKDKCRRCHARMPR